MGFLLGGNAANQTCLFSRSHPMTRPDRHEEEGEIWILHICNLVLDGGGWSATCCGHSDTRGPSTCHEGGRMGFGAGLDGTENLAPTNIQFSHHPAHSKSLYPLHFADYRLCLVLTLRMCGAICLLPLYACMTWKSVTRTQWCNRNTKFSRKNSTEHQVTI